MNTLSSSNTSGRTSCNALPQPNHTNQSDPNTSQPPTLHQWVQGHASFDTAELSGIRLIEWLDEEALPSSFPKEEMDSVSMVSESDSSKDTSGKIEKRTNNQTYSPSPLKNSLIFLAVATMIAAIFHQWQNNLSQKS